jgi:hypothetical protein
MQLWSDAKKSSRIWTSHHETSCGPGCLKVCFDVGGGLAALSPYSTKNVSVIFRSRLHCMSEVICT